MGLCGLTLKTLSESCQQTTWFVLHLDSVPSRNPSSGSKATAKKTVQQQETFVSAALKPQGGGRVLEPLFSWHY